MNSLYMLLITYDSRIICDVKRVVMNSLYMFLITYNSRIICAVD